MAPFLLCHSSCKIGIPSVKEAEALCLLEALQWTQDMKMSNIIFETDTKLVSEAISYTKTYLSEFGSIVTMCNCKAIISHEQTYSVCHVKRQANNVARTVAKVACSAASPSL